MRAEARFFDGEHARDHPVQVEITPGNLVIEAASVPRRTWALSGLAAVTPFAKGNTLRLSHDSAPGARLVIADGNFAAELARLAPHLAGGFNTARAGKLAAIIGVSLAATVATLYLILSYAPQSLAFVLPDSWRNRLGDQVESALVNQAKLCASSTGNAILRRLGERLRDGNPEAPQYELKVYDIGILNAFALPGGRIVVTRKLIDTAKTPEEVAGVVAHEIGHVHYRHAEAQFIRVMGLQLLLQIATGGGGDTITSFATLLAILRYTRDAERDADSFALATLANAAVDPLGLKRFFEEIKKLEGRGDTDSGIFGTVVDMMSTHPVTNERIEAIKPLPEGTVARPALSDADWASLRKICG